MAGQSFRFLDLPSEIRRKIYDVAAKQDLYFHIEIWTADHGYDRGHTSWYLTRKKMRIIAYDASSGRSHKIPYPDLGSLTLTCSTIQPEAISVLYQHLYFTLSIDLPVRQDTVKTINHMFPLLDWGVHLRFLCIHWYLAHAHGDFAGEHFITALVNFHVPRSRRAEYIEIKERAIKALKEAWMKLRINGILESDQDESNADDEDFMKIIADMEEVRAKHLGL